MNTDTQTLHIYRHCSKHVRGITTYEAFSRYKITRLPARIPETAKKFAVKIDSEWEDTPGGARVKRYFIAAARAKARRRS